MVSRRAGLPWFGDERAMGFVSMAPSAASSTSRKHANGAVPSPASSSSSISEFSGLSKKRASGEVRAAPDGDADEGGRSPKKRHSGKNRSPQKDIFKPAPPSQADQVGQGKVDKYEDHARVIDVDWNIRYLGVICLINLTHSVSAYGAGSYEFDLEDEKVSVIRDGPTVPNHACTPACKMYETKQGLDEYVKVVHSPLILPMLFGWMRSHGLKGSPRRRGAGLGFFHYTSPCGKAIDNELKLMDYLTKVRSILPPSCFSFDEDIDPVRKLVIHRPKVQFFHEDHADGVLKPFQIPIVNCHSEAQPEPYSFVKKTTRSAAATKEINKLNVQERNQGCRCTGLCGKSCLCRQIADVTVGPGYQCGRLHAKQTYVVECNDSCGCGPQCGNRISSSTIPFPTLLYYYPDKAWGVRAMCDIPAGTFIGFYHGQVICDEDISENHDKYLVALDLGRLPRTLDANDTVSSVRSTTEEPEFNVDGRRFGNITRFFNHSCDPNLFAQPVHKEYVDARVYNIGFFTLRNVKAGEELCWDYMYRVGSVPGREIQCRCGSSKCKGRLL